MRYALDDPGNGVDLIEGGTPFPGGAIHPVTNWDAMKLVLKKYRKIDAGAVAEMTQGEKDAVNAAELPSLADQKVNKKNAIDANTVTLIAVGVAHAAETFSLSVRAQQNWADLKQRAAGLGYPYEVITKDDKAHSVADIAAMDALCDAAHNQVWAHLDSGRALKISADAAADQAALDAVVDSR